MEEFNEVFAHEGEIFMACINEEVIGMCMISVIQPTAIDTMLRVPSRDGKVNMLYVSNKYRGKGIGEKLLVEGETYLEDQTHCDYINITVFATNDIAHSLYKKHGFIDISIDMVKKLV